MYRKLAVLLAAAAAVLTVAASAVGGPREGPTPFFPGGALGGPTYVHPGTKVLYSYQVSGTGVSKLQLTLVLKKWMRLMKNGAPRFSFDEAGNPVFVMKNINNLNTTRRRGFNFYVTIARATPKGTRLPVVINEQGVMSTGNVSHSLMILSRVPKR